MCGFSGSVCHTLGMGRSCSFLWRFMKIEKEPDQIIFDEYGRCRTIQTEDYYQLLPLSFCANFWLFMNVIPVVPFFLYSFFTGFPDGMAMPIVFIAQPLFSSTIEAQVEGASSFYRVAKCLITGICIFPLMFLMLAASIVSVALNCASAVVLLFPRLVYLVCLWYRWTWNRNKVARKISKAEE